MTRIVLAGAAPDLAETFAAATGGAHLALPGPVVGRPVELLTRLGGAALPHLLVLDSRPDARAALDLADDFRGDHPEIVVLLATDRLEELALPALRAGVHDLLPIDADPDEVRRILDRAAAAAAARLSSSTPVVPAAPDGRVITVVSSKGGAGKTTVATNIAVALARTLPHSTVIVDLDLQFGDVASALDLTPKYSLADAAGSAADGDTIALKSFLSMHETGLYVLAAPEHPAAADAITSAQISRVLQLLAGEFRYVVVDTAPGLSDHTLGALDRTTDPLLLTALSVPGVRGLHKMLGVLGQLRMFTDSRQVVVNFADTDHGISLRDVEAGLAGPVGTALPTSKAAPAATNLGVPLMQSRSRDPLAKALTPLVDSFLPPGVAVDGRGRHRIHGVSQ